MEGMPARSSYGAYLWRAATNFIVDRRYSRRTLLNRAFPMSAPDVCVRSMCTRVGLVGPLDHALVRHSKRIHKVVVSLQKY